MAALGDAGRKFLTAMLAEFAFDLPNGTLILEAARITDDLTVWRAQALTDPKAARLTIALTKTLALLLAQVGRP